MDKMSNSKFQFRIPNKLSSDFKLACHNLGVKPSEKLRELILKFLSKPNNEIPKSYPTKLLDNNTKQKKGTYTIGEMYCGPGGIGLAAKKAGFNHKGNKFNFKHLWATDNHQDSCTTFQKNILKDENQSRVICEDIKNLDIKHLPYVDGFLYGFPCNDFSNVGETKGLDGKYGPLYSYGVNYVKQKNPKFIFAENVSGISNANSGLAFQKILEELENAGEFGYELSTHLYKFEEYGIPQSRHRYIIIGFRKDLGLKFNIPKPTSPNNYKSCEEAINDPPISKNSLNHELTKQSLNVIERLKYINPGENAWTAQIPDHLKLNVKGAKLSMIYKRLDPKKPAYTVTGSGGGGTHVYHWIENRALTNRERARLQTFPDDFQFYGSKESVRKQIGMAVPVEGAKIILNSILKTFANMKYESIESNFNFQKQQVINFK